MNSISGKIIAILDPQSGESRNNPGSRWMRQEYVLETQEMYPRKVCFSIWGEDRITQANIQMDDMITIEFEINSREYKGRWYTNIEARNIMKTDAPAPGMQGPSVQMPDTSNNFGTSTNSSDDLPF